MPNRMGATKGGSAGVRQRKLESRSVSELLQAPRIYLKVLASYHGQQLSAWIFGCADLKLFGIPVVPPAMQPQRPLVVCIHILADRKANTVLAKASRSFSSPFVSLRCPSLLCIFTSNSFPVIYGPVVPLLPSCRALAVAAC
jgi:hypothetical protein